MPWVKIREVAFRRLFTGSQLLRFLLLMPFRKVDFAS